MMPFRRILFPVDFSEATTAMVPYVVELARRFDATVTLLNAFNLVPDYSLAPRIEGGSGIESGSAPAAIPYTPVYRELRKQREERLEEFSRERFSNIIRAARVEDGDPARAIEWVAQTGNIDLIMMPTKGAGKFRRLLLGSITAKILHDMSCPVFTTAHEPDPALPAPAGYRSIVCAVKLNEEAAAVFKAAGLLARTYGARLCLLHVEPSPAGHDGPALARSVRQAFDNAVSVGGAKVGVEPAVRILDASVPESIRRIAMDESADLVVVGRGHEKGNLSRIWSQLYTIIRESPCPVLSV